MITLAILLGSFMLWKLELRRNVKDEQYEMKTLTAYKTKQI